MSNANGTMILIDPSRPVDMQAMLAEVNDLPSIPETLIRILKVLDDPASGPADLTRVVRMDAPVMAKILRLANSPYYSSRGDLADINRCVAVLGYRTVRQVAICITVATSLITSVEKAGGQLDYRELWRHSVVTGAIAKHLARMTGYPDPEEAFTAGLLHDMGKFVLEVHAPQIYTRVVAERHRRGGSLSDLERETFGFDHASLGAAFAESWRFPPLLVRAFADHHCEIVGRARARHEQAAALVSLADYLANTFEPARSDLGFDPTVVDVARLHDTAGVPVELVEANRDAIGDAVDKAGAFLQL
ncbi:MAG: HDOD domain-containing protein [bacterium]|nr:HDOD domain-containing protein [bacterium]MBK9473353.1 HDOD domain-containing protein [bacterium]